jgi:hypothetical protein
MVGQQSTPLFSLAGPPCLHLSLTITHSPDIDEMSGLYSAHENTHEAQSVTAKAVAKAVATALSLAKAKALAKEAAQAVAKAVAKAKKEADKVANPTPKRKRVAQDAEGVLPQV